MSGGDKEELPGNGNSENDFNGRRAIFLAFTVANMVRFVFEFSTIKISWILLMFFLNKKLILLKFAF